VYKSDEELIRNSIANNLKQNNMINEIKRLATLGNRNSDLHILISDCANRRTTKLEETNQLEQMYILQSLQQWYDYISESNLQEEQINKQLDNSLMEYFIKGCED
jgi:hypothetical protein